MEKTKRIDIEEARKMFPEAVENVEKMWARHLDALVFSKDDEGQLYIGGEEGPDCVWVPGTFGAMWCSVEEPQTLEEFEAEHGEIEL